MSSITQNDNKVKITITPGETKFLEQKLSKVNVVKVWWEVTKLFIKEFVGMHQ